MCKIIVQIINYMSEPNTSAAYISSLDKSEKKNKDKEN